jgi:hypothetical protein
VVTIGDPPGQIGTDKRTVFKVGVCSFGFVARSVEGAPKTSPRLRRQANTVRATTTVWLAGPWVEDDRKFTGRGEAENDGPSDRGGRPPAHSGAEHEGSSDHHGRPPALVRPNTTGALPGLREGRQHSARQQPWALPRRDGIRRRLVATPWLAWGGCARNCGAKVLPSANGGSKVESCPLGPAGTVEPKCCWAPTVDAKFAADARWRGKTAATRPSIGSIVRDSSGGRTRRGVSRSVERTFIDGRLTITSGQLGLVTVDQAAAVDVTLPRAAPLPTRGWRHHRPLSTIVHPFAQSRRDNDRPDGELRTGWPDIRPRSSGDWVFLLSYDGPARYWNVDGS